MKATLPLVLITAVAATLASCDGARSVAPQPTVYFTLVPYTCSSIIPLRFYIDDALVDSDTFRISVAGGDHITSRAFATSVGQHTLGARSTNFGSWPDKSVNLTTGAVFIDSLPVYCS